MDDDTTAHPALTRLADAEGATVPTEGVGDDHPMREVTRQVAFEGGWSPGRARRIAELFDGLSVDWNETHSAELRLAPLRDALARGAVDGERWLELGAGTGAGTRILEPAVDRVVAADLSADMLAHAVMASPKLRADASRLPFGDDSFDGVAMVNMLLFADEVDRVLRSHGAVLWVNTLGERTPIHLPPHSVLDALPGDWQGTWARAGEGFWLVARRR